MSGDPLAPFGWAPSRAGLFLDFDGVLAEIAPDPDGASIRPAVPELLARLTELLGRVAVISGRPVAYLDAMVPIEVDIVGVYGLEWRTQGVHHTLREAEAYRGAIRGLAEDASARFGAIAVEPKGLSLTIHYRRDPDAAGPMRDWVREHAATAGLEQRDAKHSFEIHPPIARDKGTALLDLAEDLDPVAYVGDDLGDLPAFDALDHLSESGVGVVRVAVDSREVPPVLRRRADLVVDGSAAVDALLVRILEIAEAAPG